MRSRLTIAAVALVLLALPAAVRAQQAADAVFFEQHVRPILKANCWNCHGETAKPKGGLDLRLARFLAQGGDSGPAVVAGKPKESLLLDRVKSEEMPPGKKKLTKKEIEVLERWIAQGAKTARPEPEKLGHGFFISPDDEAFWSFQPIRKAEPPKVKNAANVRTPLDAFVLKRLEDKGLSLSKEADRRTLIRRAYFDLLGLPPSPAEVDAFVKDTAPDAWEKLLDRLLASPHYGERWARHWLDVAGYADSEGFTGEDPLRASAWRYRDYVIRSLNADKPFDEFIREQLAGDEMVKPPYEKLQGPDLDKLIATGFLRMAPDGSASKEVDLPVATNQTIADTIQIVGTSLLGITVHCAQCHDHRYDPIPQTDYYKLRAVFEPALDWKKWRKPAAREIAVLDEAARQKTLELEKQALAVDQERVKFEQAYIAAQLDKELAKVPENLRAPLRTAFEKPLAKRTKEESALLLKHAVILGFTVPKLVKKDKKFGEEVAAFQAKAAQIRASKPTPITVRALTEVPGDVPPTFLFDRGDFLVPKERMTPGTLTILAKYNLGAIPEKDSRLPTTGRRLAFAHWVTHPQNPLTPRAIVNRIWMHHFGRGLVATPADLGQLGERPTHPELLDWLAADFVASGWKLKRLHKLIMTSAVYRQSAARRPELEKVDPDNKLLGRMNLQRLEAEALRDALLAVTGKLNPKQFGPPIPIRTDEAGEIVVGVDTTDGAGRPTGKVVPLNGEEYRRSIYITVRRSKPLGMLETFDGALVTPNCECRTNTTVTPQALMLMNSQAVVEFGTMLAQRLQKEAGADVRAQAAAAWKLAFAQEPTNQEIASAVKFLEEQSSHYRQQKTLPTGMTPATLALSDFCHALFSANRFLYVD